MAVTAAELLIKIRALVEGSRSIAEVRAGIDQIDASAKRASGGLGGLGDAAAAAALAVMGKQLYDAVAAFESMNNALAALHGSQEQANADMAFIVQSASRMGVEVQTAAQAFISLTASTKGTALEGQNTRAIFEAVAGSMALLGKSSAETQRALSAISQIASKGTVSMEELRGQLGEALPGAMQASARAMGRTTEELIALVSTGTLTAEEFLPKLAAALNDTFGTEAPDTLAAGMARLQNSVQLAFKDLGDSGSVDAFKAAMEGAGFAVNLVATILLGFQEAVEVTGKSIGAFGAAVTQALSGDITGAFNSFSNNFNKVVESSGADIQRFADRVNDAGKEIGERTPPAILPAKSALDNLTKAFRQLDETANGAAKDAAKALDGLGKNIDLTTLAGVLDVGDALETLGEKAGLLQQAVESAVAKMNQTDLASFRTALAGAFEAGQFAAASYAKLNDEIAARQASITAQQIEQSGRLVAEFGKRAAAAEAAAVIEAEAAGKTIEARKLELEALEGIAERAETLLEQRKIELSLAEEELAALLKTIPALGARTKEQEKQVAALEREIQQRETGIAQSTTELAQAQAKLAEGQKLNESEREANRLRAEATRQTLTQRDAQTELQRTQRETRIAELEGSGQVVAAERAKAAAVKENLAALKERLPLLREAARVAAEDLAAAERSAGPEAERTEAVKKQIEALKEKSAATKQAVADAELEVAATTAQIRAAEREISAREEATEAAEEQAKAEAEAAKEAEEAAARAERESKRYLTMASAVRLNAQALIDANENAIKPSAEAMDRLAESVSSINPGTLDGYFNALRNADKETKSFADTVIRQSEAFHALEARLKNAASLTERDLALAARQAATEFGLLNESSLEQLRGQIEAATRANRDLVASVEDAIFAEEQRRRRLQGDELAAKQADFAKAEAELRREIREAENADVKRKLQEQLDLLRKNNDLELDQLREKERQRKKIEAEAEAERKQREAERQEQEQEQPDDQPLPTRPTPTPPRPRPEPERPRANRRAEAEEEDRLREELHQREMKRIAARQQAGKINLTLGFSSEEEDRLREELHQREMKRIAARQAAGKLNLTLGFQSVDEIYPELERRILRGLAERQRLRG